MLLGSLRRLRKQFNFGTNEAAVIPNGFDAGLETTRGPDVPPPADGHVGHFVEGQIERDQRILALK